MTLAEKRMEKLNRLYTKCRENMERIGIDVGNVCGLEVIGVSRRAGGYCVQKDNGFVIQISNIYLDDCPDEIAEPVIYHELIHTIPGCFDHGDKFICIANKIKDEYHTINNLISNQAPADNGYIIKKSKWAYVCKNCGWIQVRTDNVSTKSKSTYACPHCGPVSILQPVVGESFEMLKEKTNKQYFENRKPVR